MMIHEILRLHLLVYIMNHGASYLSEVFPDGDHEEQFETRIYYISTSKVFRDGI